MQRIWFPPFYVGGWEKGEGGGRVEVVSGVKDLWGESWWVSMGLGPSFPFRRKELIF